MPEGDPAHSADADAESRIAGGLCVFGGALLAVWAWRAAMRGEYEITPAVLGPTLLALGTGLLVHGARIPMAGINPLMRAYGLAGSVVTIAFLVYFGFFQRPAPHRALWWMESVVPFVPAVYWSLPSRYLGGAPRDVLPPRR